MAQNRSLPSSKAFRDAGWLPKNRDAYDKYMQGHRDKIESGIFSTADALLPSVREFKDFIESEPSVYEEFIRMFDDVPDSEIPRNYNELITMLNVIFREAPKFDTSGPPVYMVMAQVMNSQGGFSAFTKENLNLHFKKMFETWTRYLMSKDSRSVLNSEADGWFSPAGLEAMLKQYPNRTFEQVFDCDLNDPDGFYGYTSFEDFFNRRFSITFLSEFPDRQVDDPNNDSIVSAACESVLYAYQEQVQKVDELFIKDERYSLRHLLADNYIDEFENATVLQGFLNTTGYHRWHAPINGTIRKIIDVPGTYFAQSPYTIGMPTDVTEDDVLPPYLQSLRYFSNTAARQLMFIDAKDERIGLVCFISIGMTEISSCEATVYEGQQVTRGDELGMFHFGGSSWALVLQEDSKVKIDADFQKPDVPLKINKPIGAIPV